MVCSSRIAIVKINCVASFWFCVCTIALHSKALEMPKQTNWATNLMTLTSYKRVNLSMRNILKYRFGDDARHCESWHSMEAIHFGKMTNLLSSYLRILQTLSFFENEITCLDYNVILSETKNNRKENKNRQGVGTLKRIPVVCMTLRIYTHSSIGWYIRNILIN